MSTFPVIDGDRDFGPSVDRRVVETFGVVDVTVADMDQWAALPVRWSASAGGMCFELGPYDLLPDDARALRAALDQFCKAVAS